MTRHSRDQRGQAAAELALALPLVALLLLAVTQVGLIVRDQVLATHAAREAARAAAVGSPAGAPRAAAIAGSGLRADRLTVGVRSKSGLVRVEIRYRSPTDLPVIGPLVPDLTLSAKAAMRSESHRSARNFHATRPIASRNARPCQGTSPSSPRKVTSPQRLSGIFSVAPNTGLGGRERTEACRYFDGWRQLPWSPQ